MMLTRLGGTPSGARTCRGVLGASSYAYSTQSRVERVLAALIAAAGMLALEHRAHAQASPEPATQTTPAAPPAPPPSAAPVATAPPPTAAAAAAPPPARTWSAGREPTPAAPTAAPAAARSHEWHGWQTLVVDVAGIAAGIGVAASVKSDASPAGLVAATWYGVGIVGAPATHYADRRWPEGLGDFGMRALIPPLVGVGGLLAACTAHDEFDHGCVRGGLAGGMLVGLAATAAFDALILSGERLTEAPGPRGSWYGLQVLTIDLIGYGIGAFYALKEPRAGHDRPHPGLALWVMDYVIGSIGAPIVHFAHSNVGLGFASLGMRLVLSPIGAVIGLLGVCAATAGSHNCTSDGAQYGLFGGSLAIALFDALVFARESEEHTTASNIDVSIGAGSLGLRGSW